LNAFQENLPPRATLSVSRVLLEKNKLVLHAKIVEQVNSALVTQIPLVPIARKVLIKRKKANLIVCRVFLEHLKMAQAQKSAERVAKDNIKINLVMKPVWIVKWVDT
jgi:hypothetical protein